MAGLHLKAIEELTNREIRLMQRGIYSFANQECLLQAIQDLIKEIKCLRARSHNFYVTMKPWLDHPSKMLEATETDLLAIMYED